MASAIRIDIAEDTLSALAHAGPGIGGGARGDVGDDNIRVAVRVRPLSASEIARGDMLTIAVNPDMRSLKIDVPGPNGQILSRNFQFQVCLGPETSQAQVITACSVHRILDSVVDGYTGTLLAYGQTGSGKTYTMSGKEEVIEFDGYRGHETDGLVVRSMYYLFDAIQRQVVASPGLAFAVKASYLEIYNEQVNDLLRLENPARQVRFSATQGFYVQDLLTVDCDSIEDVFSVMSEGARNRKVGSHELNQDSSRSHSIMTVHVESTWPPTEPGGRPTTKFGKVSFVDLAGSERLKSSRSSGEMQKETTNINKSLFTLGKVISALGELKSHTANGAGSGGATRHQLSGTLLSPTHSQKGNLLPAHVPYRDSKLTQLLMDSFGGNSLSLMVACCSPSHAAVEETLSTLYYATRAKNIRNAPAVNLDPSDAAVEALRKEIRLLREENAYLRAQLDLPVSAAVARNGTATPPTAGRGSVGDNASYSGTLATAASQRSRDTSKELLTAQLEDAQRLLRKFAEANALLASDNEQLRNTCQEMESNTQTLLDDNDKLLQKLGNLETVFVRDSDGSRTPSKSGSRHGSVGGSRGGSREKKRVHEVALIKVSQQGNREAVSSHSSRGGSSGGDSLQRSRGVALPPLPSPKASSQTPLQSTGGPRVVPPSPLSGGQGLQVEISPASPTGSTGSNATDGDARAWPRQPNQPMTSARNEASEVLQLRKANMNLVRAVEGLQQRERELLRQLTVGSRATDS
eukprot:jgi/Mesvir1/23643/Mv18314-RA.4